MVKSKVCTFGFNQKVSFGGRIGVLVVLLGFLMVRTRLASAEYKIWAALGDLRPKASLGETPNLPLSATGQRHTFQEPPSRSRFRWWGCTTSTAPVRSRRSVRLASRFLDRNERLKTIEVSLADENDQLSLHRPQKCMARHCSDCSKRHTFLRPMQRELIVLVRQRNLDMFKALLLVQESRTLAH